MREESRRADPTTNRARPRGRCRASSGVERRSVRRALGIAPDLGDARSSRIGHRRHSLRLLRGGSSDRLRRTPRPRQLRLLGIVLALDAFLFFSEGRQSAHMFIFGAAALDVPKTVGLRRCPLGARGRDRARDVRRRSNLEVGGPRPTSADDQRERGAGAGVNAGGLTAAGRAVIIARTDMDVVRSRVDTGSEGFRRNRQDMLALLAEVEAQLALARAGGGERAWPGTASAASSSSGSASSSCSTATRPSSS